MPNPITNAQIKEIALAAHIDYAALKAIIEVESSGYGFDPLTDKILIQFEPQWFKRNYKDWQKHQTTWINNGIGNQNTEWMAFNDAFKTDPEAAMLSTSIGLPQIMGFHYERLGYATVGDMWDDFKKGEYEQVKGLAKFITTDKRLYTAIINRDFDTLAAIYNGAGYKAMALKYKQQPYNIKLQRAFAKWIKG